MARALNLSPTISPQDSQVIDRICSTTDSAAATSLSLARHHFFSSVNMGSLFDYLSDKLVGEPILTIVDFHKMFNEFGADHFFIMDHVHLSASANAVVGERYAREIAAMLRESAVAGQGA